MNVLLYKIRPQRQNVSKCLLPLPDASLALHEPGSLPTAFGVPVNVI